MRHKIEEYKAKRKEIYQEISKLAVCINGCTDSDAVATLLKNYNRLHDEAEKLDEKILWAKRTMEVLRMKKNCDENGNLVHRPFQKLRSMKL